MIKYVKHATSHAWHLLVDSTSFLYEGIKNRNFPSYLKAFLYFLALQAQRFRLNLLDIRCKKERFGPYRKRVKGLHALLSEDQRFSYSILIPLHNPSPALLKSCLLSACDQTPSKLEILIGTRQAISEKCLKVIEDFRISQSVKITFFDFTALETDEPLVNLLAEKAQMKFLLIIEQEDWIRPDLLFRYEQFLRTFAEPEKGIISCNENLISKNDAILPYTEKVKSVPIFPYLFQKTYALRGLLISSHLWKSCKGLRQEFTGAEIEDLFLRLDLAGGVFRNIPFCLYSHRKGRPDRQTPFNKSAFIAALKEYAPQKGLAWDFTDDGHPDSIHPIPEITPGHKIHVVILFKEHKQLTLRCLETVLKQEGVTIAITAVDNGSQDKSIAEDIEKLGAEVLHVDEPFNFSRLNNIAVEKSVAGKSCDLILFLNNDIELEKNTIAEMVRWIDQPSIGIVGARLHYPDGRLQHAGVYLDKHGFQDKVQYEFEKTPKSSGKVKREDIVSIVDGLMGACFLFKKIDFRAIGGFDEILFPICHSDTDLAEKMAKIGLRCIYTPYASAIHHEGASRKFVLEDIEWSRWMHDLASNNHRVVLEKADLRS